MPGAICLSSSSHFAAHAVFEHGEAGGVAARPRQALDEPGADRIRDLREHDRNGAGRLQQRRHNRAARGQDDVRGERDQFRRVSAMAVGIARAPNACRSARCGRGSSPLLQPLHESREAGLPFRIFGRQAP